MKNVILWVVTAGLIFSGCKARKDTETTEVSASVKEAFIPEKTIGKISHQFRSKGCATVIMVDVKGEADTLILIPNEALPAGLDKNNLDVSFNYHPLRMPQPPGCNKGIPAEITNLEKR